MSNLPSFATFGEMLHYLRRQARLTQRELAIATGYSESMISRLEHDERPPDVATILALFAPALDVAGQPDVVAQLVKLAKQARGEGTGHDQSETAHFENISFVELYPITAAKLFAVSSALLAHRGTTEMSSQPHERAFSERILAAVTLYRQDPVFEFAWQEGEKLTLEEAATLALEQ